MQIPPSYRMLQPSTFSGQSQYPQLPAISQPGLNTRPAGHDEMTTEVPTQL